MSNKPKQKRSSTNLLSATARTGSASEQRAINLPESYTMDQNAGASNSSSGTGIEQFTVANSNYERGVSSGISVTSHNNNNNGNVSSETNSINTEQIPRPRPSSAPVSMFEVHKPKRFYNYGSLLIENKGSVARDHLASERTFLAWLRTSLSLASIGVAVTQLLKINTNSSNDESQVLLNISKNIGICFVVLGIITLLMGTFRYFMIQHMLLSDQFPASKFSVGFVIVGVIGLSIPLIISVSKL